MRALFIIVLALFSFSLAPSALAATSPVESGNTSPVGNIPVVSPPSAPGTNVTLINPLNTGECAPNGNCLMNFLDKILAFVIKIGTVVVVLMTVWVGYLFVVAQGKGEKITEARNALLWTVVGALVLLGSVAIKNGIVATVQAISVGQ